MPTAAKQPSSWFLAQWKLMREATRDKRLTAVDHAVLLEILDLHLDKYGNSKCSWAHLVRTTGRSRSAIAETVARLINLGYVSIVGERRGSAKTTYKPSWGFTPNGPLDQTITDGPPEQIMMVRDSAPLEVPMVRPSGPHIHLPQPPTGALTVGGYSSESPTPASPHAPDGAEVDAAGFDSVWGAYGVRTKRAQAKATFAGLGDVTKILDEIVAAATRWHEHYEAQGTPARYRKQLHTWLRGECYLEDPPSWKAPPSAKSAAPEPTAPPKAQAAPQHCRIVSATVRDGDEGSVLTLTMQPVTGDAPIVRNLRHQTWEAAEVDALLSAAGLQAGADSDELEGREVVVDGRWYLPVPANDNDGEAAAA